MEQDTKTKIINAAKTLFSKQGYDGTSIKDICELAQVNISAVNYHFNSKLELLEIIIENFAKQSVLSAVDIFEVSADSLEECKLRVKLFYERLLKNAEEHLEALIIILNNFNDVKEIKNKDDKREMFNNMINIIANFIENGKKNGYIKENLDSIYTAKIIFFIIQKHFEHNNFIDPQNLFDKKKQKNYINNAINILFNGMSNN